MLKNSVRLWVCDNIASLTPGIDENSKESWDPINQWLLELRFSGITTIFLHHENKIGGQRGTSAREDNLDVCVSLKRPPDYAADQGARFIVNFTKSRLPLEHLPLIADHEFQFSRMAGDTYEWIWCSAKKKGRETILRLIDEGIPQNDIATQCGVTKGRISQVKSEAIREGLMTKKGKLTQMGFTSIYGDEN
jgi:putative DNA primase/helicase